jgi:3-hydroxyisobutyrate dehydrogenase-like beta-hydroxyacid dehydrogenase
MQGLLLHAIIHSAGVQDRDGGIFLLATLFGQFPFLVKLFADSAYQGPIFANALAKILPCIGLSGETNEELLSQEGKTMHIGFIGLGQMGAGMAANLVKAGHDVTVYNRTRAKAEALVAQGAKAAAGVSDTCRGDAVITMLANDYAVENVVLGDEGIIASLPAGAIHISSSTISVALSEALASAHAKAGQRFVAAPVFGRPDLATAGQLFVVAAGEHDAVEAAAPLLDAIGQKTFIVSETPKAANLVKLSGNFLIAAVIESLGEAMALVGKGGIDKRQYLDILTSTLFGAPVYKTYGRLIADGIFEPAGFAEVAFLQHLDVSVHLLKLWWSWWGRK